ncbi:MAG: polysaccharide biosynthesis protein [Ruminococcaceae bacterium]|nr:polysaccharide biosynthesis protein [Oscillospiraceae bacterium]
MNNKKAKSQNLLIGAMVLLISNLLVKVIGAVYKIPLTNMLGTRGMAYFNAAYSFYVTIYLVSTAGIPVAISRMVATSEAQGKHRESKRILKVALVLFSLVGLAATLIMMFFAKSYAHRIEIPDSYLSMYAIAPTLFFICISSTFRGYYQGKKNMTLSAIAQVIEALAKLIIGLAAVKLFIDVFELKTTSAYAISGVTIGVVLSLLFALFYHFKESRNEEIPENDTAPLRSSKSILAELVMICVPIAVSSCVTGLTRFVDTSLIVTSLRDIGVVKETAESLYGAFSSIVISLLDMPPSLITPLAISLLPNLAQTYASKDKLGSYSTIDSSFRVGSLIAFPCTFGMAFVSEGIIRTLFREEYIDGTQILNSEVCAEALTIVSISIFFLAMIAITNSILQAWRREIFPIVSALCGIGVKCVTEYILLRIPGMGINGAALSTVACHFTIILMNLIFVIKFTGYVPKVTKIFAKPLFAGLFCGVGAYFTYMGLDMLTTDRLAGRTQALICLVPAVGVAAVIYVAALAVMKGFVREDIEMLPKGKKICALLTKFKAM